MAQFDAQYIDRELGEIGRRISGKLRIYLIGGCAMSFRKLKETTKDVDIVFVKGGDYAAFCHALFGAQYYALTAMKDEHGKLMAEKMYENKDGFHLDLFVKKVCGKFELSEGMQKRAEFFKNYGNMEVYLVAKEDIFIFKSVASEGRRRDLDDMWAIYPNLGWKAMKREILPQKLFPSLGEIMIRRLEEFGKLHELDVPILAELKI